MKPEIKLISALIACCLAACILCSNENVVAQTPNSGSLDPEIYRTMDITGDPEVEHPYVMSWFYHRALQTPMPEEGPAGKDMAGNWGPSTNGFQMSVRLNRRQFMLGEPVVATIVLRNAESNPKSTWLRGRPDHAFDYIVQRGTNLLTWVRTGSSVPREAQSGGEASQVNSVGIPPHAQMVILVQLQKLLDLQDLGDYSVQVRFRERLLNGEETARVVSGTARFEIVERLAPSEVAATNAYAEELKSVEQRAIELLARRERESQMRAMTNAPAAK